MTLPMSDFQFSYNHALFPEPPAVPPSSELFSASETDNIFGFLDDFSNWDLDGEVLAGLAHQETLLPPPPPSDSYYGAYPELHLPGSNGADSSSPSSMSTEVSTHPRSHPYPRQQQSRRRRSPSLRAESPESPRTTRKGSISSMSGTGTARSRPLLDDKQKRMNHIMSEQKRRNAIRDGYAQLTALLAPAGAPPSTGLPTRGRPKGSGAKGKGRPGAGKSGVLLRAVEYCRWLEEGRNALLEEVRRVETAAGIRVELQV